MKAFVTGATGFVGANVVRSLLAEGHDVRVLVRPGANTANLSGLNVEQAPGSLADKDGLKTAMKGCNALFHVAALYSLWGKDAEALYRANVDGTRNILAAAKEAGIERVVYTSSVAALGVPAPGQIGDETLQTTAGELVSDYKKSKYLAEQEALRCAREGQHIVIVNPSTPIGAYDVKPTPTGDIVLRFLNKRMPAYVDTGLNIVDVEDVARAHILALERGKPGERYILGNRNLTLKDLLDILSSLTGMKAPSVRIPHLIPLVVAWIDEGILAKFGKHPDVAINSVRMSHKAMYYDSSKAIRELGMPQSPIEGALDKAVKWFRDNGYVRA